MNKALVTLCVVWASIIPAMPLSSHSLGAKTPEEFDLYLDFHEATDPEAKHGIALRFERAFPESELLGSVYESEFEYARSHEQRESAVAVGKRWLHLEPNNIKTLLGLAEVLPYGTSDPQMLLQAEQYARTALAALDEMQLPREVTRNDCDRIRKSWLSRAHAALGYVLAKSGSITEAIKELEIAIAVSPEPVGSQLLFAGKLYRTAKQEQDAIDMFRRAAQAGPSQITSLAETELQQSR